MTRIYKKIEQWIRDNFKGADHLTRTVFWLEKIYPSVNEAMKIAAVAHDMERSFSLREGEAIPNGLSWKDFENEEYLLWHGKRSAEFLELLLRENNVDEEIIEKIKDLVTYHELGGDVEKDAIKDADSVSFLEINAPKFIKDIPGRLSKEEAMIKFDYMYNRISSEDAKKLAGSFYNKAIEELKKL